MEIFRLNAWRSEGNSDGFTLEMGLFEDEFLCRLEIDEWNNKRCAQALE